MKPDGMPPVMPTSSDDVLQSGEALLDVGSWSEEKATAPLRLSFEVHDRAAACIRLSASVSGLSVHEVARRCIESFDTASKNIATFTELFFNHVVAGEVRQRTIEGLAPERQQVWKDLQTHSSDITLTKNRYSALVPGASTLERVLRNLGIDTVLIAGTKTNICCEATARDAMMLDFKVVMISDCCAALSDDEHRSALENIIQQFGDVMTSGEILDRLAKGAGPLKP
jgi:nicotinamidase-related amidase